MSELCRRKVTHPTTILRKTVSSSGAVMDLIGLEPRVRAVG